MPTREDAWHLLCEYTESDSLKRHGLAVEQVMRKMAKKYGEDKELWGMTGLLHDFDYEKYPTMEEHPYVGNKIRESLMAKALYAADEISGFIFAVTYVRPSKSVHDVKVKSVKKKLKQKSFAASVNRAEVYEGPEELGVPLEEHIQFIIDALKEKAEDLGLAG
ncbi:MAG TPA: HDIG domain-containing protein [Candidatus Marinimicrobia bacterium]|nr:HDIG domain-containing protein [Candidatus Neomarinimicrobiota bacterium]